MGRKSMLIENAYAFALRQQEVMLQGSGGGDGTGENEGGAMTEQESVEMVERLLREEARANRREGREVAKGIEEWRSDQGDEKKKLGGSKGDESDRDGENNADDTTVPSILHDRPRALRALNIWSARLQSVPYYRWTIGASTALDHWIAREVLQMDEMTWQMILEGGGTDAYGEGIEVLSGGESKTGLIDRIRDIVTVRGALFPETLRGSNIGESKDGEILGDLDEELDEEAKSTEKSIDELLASLCKFDDDEDGDSWKFDEEEEEKKEEEKEVEGELESLESIMDELQVWRERNASSPYESWDLDRKKEFDVRFRLLQFIVLLMCSELSSSYLCALIRSSSFRQTYFY